MGINVADIAKLKMGGITSIKGVLMTHSRILLKFKGLSEVKVEKVKEAARKLLACGEFLTGLEMAARRKNVVRISTGSKEVSLYLQVLIQSLINCWVVECKVRYVEKSC